MRALGEGGEGIYTVYDADDKSAICCDYGLRILVRSARNSMESICYLYNQSPRAACKDSLRSHNKPRERRTYAKEACGAMKTSNPPFNLPNNLAVKLLLPLCTSLLISKVRTNSARPLWRIWALIEGHTDLIKAS